MSQCCAPDVRHAWNVVKSLMKDDSALRVSTTGRINKAVESDQDKVARLETEKEKESEEDFVVED